MYTAKNAIDEILKKVPEFTPRWEKHVQEWDKYFNEVGGGHRTVGMDISEFSSFVAKLLEEGVDYDYNSLFTFVEELLVQGDEEVGNAIATQFLENLVNISSNGRFPLDSFAKYLGEESKAYCKAWDDFCGVDSGDIWD